MDQPNLIGYMVWLYGVKKIVKSHKSVIVMIILMELFCNTSVGQTRCE